MRRFPLLIAAHLLMAALALNVFGTDPVFDELRGELGKKWPKNRTVRLVFHGHSVPAGYFRDGNVRTFDAYPSLLHRQLCEHFPTAVIDVCVTAIGGENSLRGAKRFKTDVLSMRPDLVFIDYSLNDRSAGLSESEQAWRSMIDEAQKAEVQVVLLTPTPDSHENILDQDTLLAQHAAQVRRISKDMDVPLIDSYAAFRARVEAGTDVNSLLSQPNHPNRAGHEVVAELLGQLLISGSDGPASR
ncbi:MAG: SGNH/GDSL hydrolase family protein [Rubripirellula sp.]